MNLDDLATVATQELIERTRPDPTDLLDHLQRTRRQRIIGRWAAAATVVVLMAGTWLVVQRDDNRPQPAGPDDARARVIVAAPNNTGGSWRVFTAFGADLQLPRDAAPFPSVAFTADGSELVYPGPGRTMRAIDVTTGENRILGFCLDNHCEGALSPDGTRLVYGAEEHLKIQSIATGDAEPLLTPGVDEAAAPVWSPDGRTIAFQGNDGIYAIEVETERLDRLYELPDGESLALPPAWSPDGSTLAFLESRPLPDSPNQERSFTVVRVGADGSDPRELHAAGHCVCLGLPAPTVTWTPDGEQITVTVTQSAEGAGLYTMAPDGTDWTLLRPGVYGDVDWQPLVE